MNIGKVIQKLTDFNTELTPEDRGDIAEALLNEYGQYMPLEADKLTTFGDHIIDESETYDFISAFKPLTCPMNVTVGSLNYDVYRKFLI